MGTTFISKIYNSLPPKIRVHYSFLGGPKLKKLIFLLEHNQCTKYYDTKQVMFSATNQIKISVSLKQCDSSGKTKLIWDGGSI